MPLVITISLETGKNQHKIQIILLNTKTKSFINEAKSIVNVAKLIVNVAKSIAFAANQKNQNN